MILLLSSWHRMTFQQRTISFLSGKKRQRKTDQYVIWTSFSYIDVGLCSKFRDEDKYPENQMFFRKPWSWLSSLFWEDHTSYLLVSVATYSSIVFSSSNRNLVDNLKPQKEVFVEECSSRDLTNNMLIKAILSFSTNYFCFYVHHTFWYILLSRHPNVTRYSTLQLFDLFWTWSRIPHQQTVQTSRFAVSYVGLLKRCHHMEDICESDRW